MSGFDYRHILDVFTDAVVVGDRTGRIVYLNRSAERLLDWSAEALVGQPITAIVPAALRGRHTAGFNRYRATRSARLIGREVRVPVLRRNGTEIRVELSLASFRGAAGEELYVANLRGSGHRSGSGERTSGELLQTLLASPLGTAASLDPEALAREALRIATATLGATQSRLWLHAAEAGELHLPGRTRPSEELGEPSSGRIDLHGDKGLVAEAGRSGRMIHHRAPWEELGIDGDWARRHQVETVLAVPLVHGGALQGVLTFFAGPSVTEEHLAALRLFGVLLAAALRGREIEVLRAERDRYVRRADAFRDVTARIAAHEPLPAVLDRVLAHALQLTGADEDSLLCVDPERRAYVVRACAGYKTPITGLLVPFGTGLTHEVVTSGAPVRVDDYQAYPLAVPRIRQRGVRAALGVPIRTGSTILGALKLETKKADRTFSASDEQIATTLADLAALALLQSPDETR